MPRYSLNYVLFWLLLGLASMLILTRIVPQLRFFFPLLLLVLIIIWGIWAWREWSKRQAFENSKEGAIHSKINFCREEINRNKKEIADILENIAELTTRLNENMELTTAYRQETTQLINDFKKEQQLRTARIDFYEACIRKLDALLHHQQMAQTLARKRKSSNNSKNRITRRWPIWRRCDRMLNLMPLSRYDRRTLQPYVAQYHRRRRRRSAPRIGKDDPRNEGALGIMRLYAHSRKVA
ncbi:MAG: hypothetical protein IPN33_15495 [Saprospiraceae bacterium]|nr:hypothetical protein [Saprospiraceae bacterium]